jgi:predicted GNAT superfamily acetyltransferase
VNAVLRAARPDDYAAIVSVVDEWWGRPMAHMMPRLFLDHFHATSLVAEREGALAGFLIGFHSPSQPARAYVHFVGVAPDERRTGLARRLYTAFFDAAIHHGCTTVNSITGPANTGSIAFHRAMGFAVRGPVPDYDGPGADRMVFSRPLAAGPGPPPAPLPAAGPSATG